MLVDSVSSACVDVFLWKESLIIFERKCHYTRGSQILSWEVIGKNELDKIGLMSRNKELQGFPRERVWPLGLVRAIIILAKVESNNFSCRSFLGSFYCNFGKDVAT